VLLFFILKIYTYTERRWLSNPVKSRMFMWEVREKLIRIAISVFILPRRHRRQRWGGRHKWR
jgi:hypothetical protein